MEKQKKSIKQRVQEEFPEFADAMNARSVDELNASLAVLAKSAEEIDDAKEADEELAELSAKLSEMKAPYRDGQKAVRMKSKFVIALIREKGGA